MLDDFFIGSDVFVLNFQPLFSSLLITQEFNQDLKKSWTLCQAVKMAETRSTRVRRRSPIKFLLLTPLFYDVYVAQHTSKRAIFQ